jgi:hypothetical protein
MRGQPLRIALATSFFLAIAVPTWSCGTMEPPSSGPASGPPDNSGSTNNNGGGEPSQGAGGGNGGSWNNGGAEGMRQGADNAANVDMDDGGGGGGRRSQPPGGGSQNLSSQISSLGAAQANDPAGGGGLAPVWCLMQRQGPDANQEQTVIRCDDMAGAGPGWRPVASNLTFTSASSMRDSFNSGNPPTVWCLMQRMRDDGSSEQTVIRCDNMAGAGPGWFPVSINITFVAASALRDSFNAANPPK